MNALYQDLSSRVNAAGSKYIPRIFEIIADEDEARLMLAMPATPTVLSQKTGIGEERVQKMLKDLFQKGLVFYSKKTDPPIWRMCRSVGQFHDASILWPGVTDEFLNLWKEYCETEWIDSSEAAAKQLEKPMMRVIPIDSVVESDHQVLPFEDVRKIVENAHNIAVVPCPCRVAAKKCDKPKEVCMQLNRAADYAIERGTGRKLSKEEAVKVLREAQQAGLVHMTGNSKVAEHVICNCCGCCCIMIPVLVQRGVGMLGPSRYLAEINEDDCTVCGTCEDACPFKAIAIEDIAVVNSEKCLGCGVCAVACPVEAIKLKLVRDPESVPG
jgi:Na+-translocating ferredoxin:NAD+ oxidoreductase RNF subunit RnfB